MKWFLTICLMLSLSMCFAQVPNSWDSIADFSAGQRQRAVSFALNGLGYVCTGLDTADQVRNDLWLYNVQTDSWTQRASLPAVGRRNAVAFTLEDKAYVGTGVDHAQAPLGNILNDFWAYDPSSNSWSQIANYPGGAGNGVYFATAFTAGGKGYVCGGKQGPDWYTSDLYEYKPSLDQWIVRAPFPGGVRYQMASFAVDGMAYLGLGADEDIYRKDWYQYNPGSNQWEQKGDFTGGVRGAMVSFNLMGRGYLCMGTDGGYHDDLWEYNHFSDTWIVRDNFPGKGRKFASAFTVSNVAYVGIGRAFDGSKRSFKKYYPTTPAAIAENLKENFKVYPNPVHTSFSVTKEVLNKTHKIELRNNHMQLIETFQMADKTTFHLDKTHSPGSYHLVFKSENGNVLGSTNIVIL